MTHFSGGSILSAKPGMRERRLVAFGEGETRETVGLLNYCHLRPPIHLYLRVIADCIVVSPLRVDPIALQESRLD